MAKPVYSLAQILAKIAGTPEFSQNDNVTYSFTLPAGGSYLGPISALNGTQQAFVHQAMAGWDSMSNLTFSAGGGSGADIKLMNVQNPMFAGAQTGDQILLSSSYSYMQTPSLGNYGYMAIIHEIGHSLGLNHPGSYNGGSPTYERNAAYMQDTQQYTVMSYFSASYSGANHMGYYASTPLLHDIAAIHKMYGADMSARAGNTVYGFGSTAGAAAYDFTVNTHPIICIWDGSGTDTLNVSGFSNNQVIDLRQGYFSDVGGLTKNVSIAYNCNIENAVGGAGNDSLMGNSLNNVLNGGAGNDTLNGEGGEDTLIGGLGNDTYLINSAGDVIQESAGGGTDTVTIATSYTLGANLENLTLLGTTAINATGNAANNVLTGNSAANVLDGVSGEDTMIGGKGNDTYYVNSAGDVVQEATGGGTDTVFSTVTLNVIENVEIFTFSGSANVNGTGNALNNTMTGNSGHNTLRGGAGNDTLYGGAGNDHIYGQAGVDRLYGGAGADIFHFDATSAGGRDVIYDFNIAEGDALDVRGALLNFSASMLTSFVKLTVSGANEILFLDRDGAGNSYSFAQYALLDHVSGLTAQSLYNGGDLIA